MQSPMNMDSKYFQSSLTTLPPSFAVTSRPILPLEAKLLHARDIVAKYPEFSNTVSLHDLQQPFHHTEFSPPSYPQQIQIPSMQGLLQGWSDIDKSEIGSVPKSSPATTPAPKKTTDSKEANKGTTFFYRIPNSRQRTAQACDKCRDRKTKCSGERPVCQRCLSRGLICRFSERESRLRNSSKARHKNRAGRGNGKTEHMNRASTVTSPKKTNLPSKPVLQSGASLRPTSGLTAQEQLQQLWKETPALHDSSKVQPFESSGIRRTPTTSTIIPRLSHQVTPSLFENSRVPFAMFDPYMQVPNMNLDMGRQHGWNRPNDHVSESRLDPLPTSQANTSHLASSRSCHSYLDPQISVQPSLSFDSHSSYTSRTESISTPSPPSAQSSALGSPVSSRSIEMDVRVAEQTYISPNNHNIDVDFSVLPNGEYYGYFMGAGMIPGVQDKRAGDVGLHSLHG